MHRLPGLLKAALLIRRYGMSALKQTVAGGQYEFPQGLFFGGRHIKFADANRFLLRGPLGGETRALFFGNLDALTDLGHFRLELLQQMA